MQLLGSQKKRRTESTQRHSDATAPGAHQGTATARGCRESGAAAGSFQRHRGSFLISEGFFLNDSLISRSDFSNDN